MTLTEARAILVRAAPGHHVAVSAHCRHFEDLDAADETEYDITIRTSTGPGIFSDCGPNLVPLVQRALAIMVSPGPATEEPPIVGQEPVSKPPPPEPEPEPPRQWQTLAEVKAAAAASWPTALAASGLHWAQLACASEAQLTEHFTSLGELRGSKLEYPWSSTCACCVRRAHLVLLEGGPFCLLGPRATCQKVCPLAAVLDDCENAGIIGTAIRAANNWWQYGGPFDTWHAAAIVVRNVIEITANPVYH